MTRSLQHLAILFAATIAIPLALAQAAADSGSRIVNRTIESRSFASNKIGTSAARQLSVYLPPGYDGSAKRYPVIYFLPNPFESYRFLFDQRQAQSLFDTAIERRAIEGFVFVTVDMNTPLGCSWYVNSPVTGNWEDFVIEELVPFVDANFRTLPRRESRGIAGDRMGGYGAIRFGMRHPEVFGSVYALHPVGTGSGLQPMFSRPNWDLLAHARSLDEVKGDLFSAIFLTIFQAHIPNAANPPLYVDMPAHKVADRLVVDAAVTERLHDNYFLERLIGRYADNLNSLRGFKFDWGRNDTIQDHVVGNQSLTHKLDEFGVAHEAEEYRGVWGERNWGRDGRVYNAVLPFFERTLVFADRARR